MPTYNMKMTLEYAQLFPENMDKGNDTNDAGRKAASMGGKYKVNAYLTSQEQYDKLIADGMKASNLGHARFKDGNSAYGIGKFINLHRYQEDVKKFTNKNKEKIEIEAGGAPKVWDLRNGADNKTPWDFGVDGAIGNGSEAIIKFSTYRDGAGVRLDAVGILVHIPYSGSDNASSADNWDETVVDSKASTVTPTTTTSTVTSGKTTDKAFHDDEIPF